MSDASRPSAPALPCADWEHTTLRLNKADTTLLQALGDTGARRPSLILHSGEHSGMRFAWQGKTMSLGRSPECDVCLESPGVSRRHAELRDEAGKVVLHDLGSSNGTQLNEVRIDAPATLKDGDLVRLGAAVLKFYEPHSLDALLHERLYRLATVDSGTGLFSKKYLMEVLEREVKGARRSGRPLSVLCVDLDFFKAVNDRFGHAAGDQVLRGVAAAALHTVRGSDIMGRIGGEGFAVVLPDTALSAAVELAERLRQAIGTCSFALPVPGTTRTVAHRQTASFGAAELSGEMPAARALLGAADAMLLDAKRSGRNVVSA